jgi:hypothetical protein
VYPPIISKQSFYIVFSAVRVVSNKVRVILDITFIFNLKLLTGYQFFFYILVTFLGTTVFTVISTTGCFKVLNDG